MLEPVSRRERNKQDKLRRITRAAQELFAEHGVGDVTTQQVAERADVGVGTLFLYARTKGELLLLAHNSSYEDALARGAERAAAAVDVLTAVMAVVEEVVACNRQQPENGRAYLREMVFGDPTEPHHATALGLSRRTEEAVAASLVRLGSVASDEAATRARIVTAVMLLAMASPLGASAPVAAVVDDIRRQVAGVVDRRA